MSNIKSVRSWILLSFLALLLSGCTYNREDSMQRMLASLWGVYMSSWYIYRIMNKKYYEHKHYRIAVAIAMLILSMTTPAIIAYTAPNLSAYTATGKIIPPTYNYFAKGFGYLLPWGMFWGVIFAPVAFVTMIVKLTVCSHRNQERDDFAIYLIPIYICYGLLFAMNL